MTERNNNILSILLLVSSTFFLPSLSLDPALRNSNRQPRIVGGNQVRSNNDYPWFVAMDDGCGGTLIHENIILTAGHCIEPNDLDPDVWIGAYERRVDGERRRINGYLIHQEYEYDHSRYDFALATIDEPTPDIPLIRLNRNPNVPARTGERLTVIGHGSGDTFLQEVDIPFVPHQACQNKWNEEFFPIDDPTMICAGGEQGRDSCDGDSGGPLLASDGTQVGLASFGISNCGELGWPAVYSRVSIVQDWIDDFICANALSPPSHIRCGARCPTHIEMEHDENVNEIRWSLRDLTNDEDILFVPQDYTIDPGTTITRTVNLQPGRYAVRIEGSNDNIGGRYRIHTDCQDNDEILDGNFGYEETVEFEVFDFPTDAPTPYSDDGQRDDNNNDFWDPFFSTPAPTPFQAIDYSGGGAQCVSPYLVVEVKDKGPVFIKDVQMGHDEILISNNNNNSKEPTYETIYAFTHRDTYTVTTFVQIYTTHKNGDPIELTGDHLLFKKLDYIYDTVVPVRADTIQVGDILVTDDADEVEIVLEVARVQRQGVYAPQTKDGTFLGAGVKLSAYAALHQPEGEALSWLQQQQEEQVMTLHHLLQHVAMAPFRFLCTSLIQSAANNEICQATNADGHLLFVATGQQMIDTNSNNNTVFLWLQQSLSVLVALVGTMAFYSLEDVFVGVATIVGKTTVTLLLLSCCCCWYFQTFTQRRMPKATR